LQRGCAFRRLALMGKGEPQREEDYGKSLHFSPNRMPPAARVSRIVQAVY
jgi:hypothetical protein